jgi:multisubunit Na+/H+ antiporter MnhG subunit
MNLDLRIPMGLMFLIVGAIMSIFGLFTRGSVIYERSAGMNINLIWGVVMLAFGLIMFLLGRTSDKRAATAEPIEGTTRPLGGRGHGMGH